MADGSIRRLPGTLRCGLECREKNVLSYKPRAGAGVLGHSGTSGISAAAAGAGASAAAAADMGAGAGRGKNLSQRSVPSSLQNVFSFLYQNLRTTKLWSDPFKSRIGNQLALDEPERPRKEPGSHKKNNCFER